MSAAKQSGAKRQVALFVTCLTDQFYPRVGVAVVKVLERLGCEVAFPRGQTCCGQPFYNNGFHDQARELAKHLVEVFEGCEYIVTPSASCCAMVREHYPRLLGGDPAWDRAMRHVCARTYEFVEFVNKVLRADLAGLALKQRVKTTYHYTCHQRAIGLTDEAERMVRGIGNVQFVEMERAEECCGFGGTFALKYPQVSGAIAEGKAQMIGATGAEVTVCNEAGCTMSLAGMCRRRGVKTEVKHVAELLAEAMGIEVDGW
jgi:L-lactate dehydrogenase complex protein LldE